MTEFRTDAIFEALRKPLGLIDNEERRKQIEAFIEAARVPLERSVFDLLSQFADAVDAQAGAHYEVTLAYRPGVLDLSVKPRAAGEPMDETFSFVEGDVEKITIRIPGELKDLVGDAASQASLSVNSWLVRMLARSLRSMDAAEPPGDEGPRHGGHGRRGPGGRLSGWVGPE